MPASRRLVPAALSVLALVAVGVPLIDRPAEAATGTPTYTTYTAPASLPSSNDAGEPSIGVNDKTGAVMYQAYASTYRFTPSNATWANVTPSTSKLNIDPILATDHVTGRTWAGGLAGECSTLNVSDNDGGSWTPAANTCTGTIDHETIGSGAWKGGQPLGATYPRAVYYCAQLSADACATSSDGGVTYRNPTPVTGVCNSLHGHVKVAPNGTAYLPNANCGGKIGGGTTTNNGLTWSSYTIPGSSTQVDGFDPSVGVASDSTTYEAWAGSSTKGDYKPYASVLPVGGAWSAPKDISNGAVPTSTFQAAVAGDGNRAAVAYLGSTTSGDPFVSTWHGVWDLYVSSTSDAGATWSTVKVTTDPVQRGYMCAGGTSCSQGRNLLDFMDANVTPAGNVVVGYADGCIGVCAAPGGTEAQSSSAYATISMQTGGQSLLSAYDGAAPVAGLAPAPSDTASPTPTDSASPTPTP